ncbi:hypothetical protein VM1G_04919 [Cytospora mali]|uniref:VWFA domain-containing protein n=1 Tax=Cytospora mali TaxID=578113 RepID=A0A194VYY4_CYTMA|nr:hypothetical protein VM1G_04919 [Valsa mali]
MVCNNPLNILSVQRVVVPIRTSHNGGDEPPPYTETQETSSPSADATVNIQPLPDKNGVIVTVQPPKVPANDKLSHVPCDIALVIDVSGSMGDDAPVPGEGERTGLSVLDLVKHACRTIMSTMTAEDRLAIVTFSNASHVLQPLTPMTDFNKEITQKEVEAMSVRGCTNLWHGLKAGIKLFENEENSGRVPAVMILTDGVPNHMCPPQGYVPALRAMGNIVPSIHTFGFGYELRSGLLKSIAEFGKGNYSFIPDAGMIGTVFVHAVANLQSTFAIDATLRLTYPDHVTIQQQTGASVDQQDAVLVAGGNYEMMVSLGNIQYGQTRDIYLQWKSNPENDDELSPPFINVALQYSQMTGTQYTSHASRSLRDLSFTTMSDAEIAYHISRSRICVFLSELFPIDPLGEHRASQPMQQYYEMCESEPRDFIASLPATHFPKDIKCNALLQDLHGPEPLGQISLALSRKDYFTKWGQHYLPSLHGAHARQQCNSFKDPGPLQYGVDSPLFIKCRDALSNAFDDLPAPKPSNIRPPRHRGGAPPPGGARHRGLARFINMSLYNSSSAPCFAGHTRVRLAGGRHVRISSLRKGVCVATPLGPREVAAVLVTPVRRVEMVRLEGVLVTPFHPVALPTDDPATGRDEGYGWVFPAQVRPLEVVRYSGAIYSVLLQRSEGVGAHAIALRGEGGDVPFWGVTLGHGMMREEGRNDVRTHRFFGDYDRVVRSLEGLRVRTDGLVLGGGVKRNKTTGLVNGFKAYRRHGRRCVGASPLSIHKADRKHRAVLSVKRYATKWL